MSEEFELAIVGGGPAGAAAAVYAARKRIKTLLLIGEWGGQSTVSTEIQNWIGTPTISGAQLAENLRKHAEAYAGEWLTIKTAAWAKSISAADDRITINATVAKAEVAYSVRALLVTSGANRRTLDVPGAKEYDQKGLTYCASCDGPLFADKDVAVIGGGNAAFETALQLLAYCKSVTLLIRSENFRADKISVDAALSDPKMRVLKNTDITAIEGEQFVTGVRWKDSKTGTESVLPVEGVFVEIGFLPNTAWVDGAIEKTAIGQIKVNASTQRTSHPHIWAAGDCTDGPYHQNNIAAGDAVKAIEDIYMTLRRG